MAICYDLHGKKGPAEPIDGGRHNTKKDSYNAMKKLIRQFCDIDPELQAIVQKGLPSPRYRASVYRYLKAFFKNGIFIAPEHIDYSDYKGKVREFPPKRPQSEEKYATGYERKMGFIEYYDNENVTSYDEELGFIFSVGKQGMHLELLGSRAPFLCSRYTFQICGEGVVFNFEPGTATDSRPALDLRSYKSDGELPPKLSGNFYPVLLLNILLNETKMRPISLHENEDYWEEGSDPEKCLVQRMGAEIYEKINEGFVLPSEINFSERTIERYIETLQALGFGVKEDKRKIQTWDYSGEDKTLVYNKYYIPPYICKHDAELILKSIKRSVLPNEEKNKLIEKFKRETGYHRFAKNDTEEADTPMPIKGECKTGAVPLMIFNLLRLCGRPIPVTSTKKDNLKDLIKDLYGRDKIDRKAISNNAKAMVALGLPIMMVNGKFCFDTSKLLLKDDLDTLAACIDENGCLDNATKTRLTQKLFEKFPVGKY